MIGIEIERICLYEVFSRKVGLVIWPNIVELKTALLKYINQKVRFNGQKHDV